MPYGADERGDVAPTAPASSAHRITLSDHVEPVCKTSPSEPRFGTGTFNYRSKPTISPLCRFQTSASYGARHWLPATIYSWPGSSRTAEVAPSQTATNILDWLPLNYGSNRPWQNRDKTLRFDLTWVAVERKADSPSC
jgi:hypothetical protein